MQISKETLKKLFSLYVKSLPSKNPKKAVERIKKVEIFQIYPNPHQLEEAIVILGSPKQFKGPHGETLKGFSKHILKFNPTRRTISCSCPAFRKHKICKHILKVLTILYLQNPTYLYRKLIFPGYKSNRKRLLNKIIN